LQCIYTSLNNPTPNDYIHFVSLIFSEKYRDRIPLLFKPTHNMIWSELDSRRMEVRTLWNGITYNFQDIDVKVHAPMSWTSHDAVVNIENHTSYNPNNEVRIKIPRTAKMLQE